MQLLFRASLVFAVLLTLVTFIAPQSFAECIPYTSAPNLYQVNRTSSTSATLYFTPLNDSIKSYIVDYGLSSGDRRYSVKFDYGQSSGAIAYTINGLDPAFHYYYTVSAISDCSQSPWSNWLSESLTTSESAKLKATDSGSLTPGLPAPGSTAVIIGGLLTAGFIFGGATIFKKTGISLKN